MIGFIGTSLQLEPIITAHNQWLSTTRSIPYWTTSVFSFTVTNDERRFTAQSFSCLERSLPDESLTNELRLFYNFQATRIEAITSKSEFILLLFMFCWLAPKRRNVLLSNGGSTVDCVTSKCVYRSVVWQWTILAFRRHDKFCYLCSRNIHYLQSAPKYFSIIWVLVVVLSRISTTGSTRNVC
jgi:hypothetical protein